MTRSARIVVPELPHHIVHRGNLQQPVFFCDDDYRSYINLLRYYAARFEVCIDAYCLMPNHVHLSARPAHHESFASMMRSVARMHSRHLNERAGTTGHSWAGRYHSTVMDEFHACAAKRYIHENPVRAGLVTRAEDWPWSSARAYRLGVDDPLVGRRRVADEGDVDERTIAILRQRTATGWPAGSRAFIEGVRMVGP